MSNVLIVEDNDLNMKLFSDLLRVKKHNVISSSTGVGILDLVKTQKPDLILMDIQLKGISGIDLIKELKEDAETLHIPIIAITAFAMKHDEIKITESGCNLYLSKPVSIDKFFEAVQRLL